MIRFKDGAEIERAIEFNLSYCGKFINLTLYDPPSRGGRGSTWQVPLVNLPDLIDNLNNLKNE